MPGGSSPIRSPPFFAQRFRPWFVGYFERVRDAIGPRLAPADRDALDVLLDPEDPLSLRRRHDLFLLTANTVHRGSRA